MRLLSGSLFKKIIGCSTVVLVVLLGASSWVQWRAQETNLSRQLAESVTESSMTLDATLRHAMLAADMEEVSSILTRVGELETVKNVWLLDENGKAAPSVSASMGAGQAALDPAVLRTPARMTGSMERTSDGRHFVRVVSPVRTEAACVRCHDALKVGDPAGYIAYERWADSDLAEMRTAQHRSLWLNLALIGSVVLVLGLITRAIVRPLRSMTRSAAEIAKGDLDQVIGHRSNDEIGDLAQSFRELTGYLRSVADSASALNAGDIKTLAVRSEKDVLSRNFDLAMRSVEGLIEETKRLTSAAVAGRLETRGDADRFLGGYREVIEGINQTLDAVISPLHVAANRLDRIGKGEIPPHITETYAGDFNTIKDSVNTCIDSIAAVHGLIADASRMSQEVVGGNLTIRGDLTRHQGDFRKVMQGVNDILDAAAGPIQEATEVLERVAGRDLTARMTGEFRGDLNRMKESLNRAIENLDEGMQQVASVVDQVVTAAGEIGSGSRELAQGASEQAGSLEEVSGSLQEMNSMTKQNAGNAKEARALAAAARESADQGLDSMNRLSTAMEKIKNSSDATAKIVKTIDEIAFQTNLLALNAAVEAARAGDAGKGFAVVAEEVRNLAMRSAEAAKTTADLIEESVHNAENGSELNHEALTRLRGIDDQTNKVGEVMAEISLGTEQQSSGIDQITGAVEEMNLITQQNAAGAEESAAGARELSGQADELRGLVESFKLSRSRRESGDGGNEASSPNWRRAA